MLLEVVLYYQVNIQGASHSEDNVIKKVTWRKQFTTRCNHHDNRCQYDYCSTCPKDVNKKKNELRYLCINALMRSFALIISNSLIVVGGVKQSH